LETSVQARGQLQREFGGAGSYALQVVVHSSGAGASATRLRRTVAAVERVLATDPAVAAVIPPRLGASISADGRTAIVVGAAARGPNEMVAAADRLGPEIAAAAAPGTEANLTGAAAMWADFNEANREAPEDGDALDQGRPGGRPLASRPPAGTRCPRPRWSAARPPRTTTSSPRWRRRYRWRSSSSSGPGSCCY
jgi:MMPL family